MLDFAGVAMVSAAGWLISLAFPRSASRRHLVLCATVVACLLLPGVVALRGATNWTWLAIPGSRGAGDRNHTGSPMHRRTDDDAGLPQHRSDDETAGSPGGAVPRLPGGGKTRIGETRLATGSPDSAGNPVATKRIAQSATGLPDRWTGAGGWAAVGYGAVAIGLLLRTVAGIILILRLKRHIVIVEAFAGDIPVAEADVIAPLAIGFGRRVIILPRGFPESVDAVELRDVLVHEAAHLRRGDHWAMLLQQVTAAAYWPILTVHLVNRALSRTREELCDNAVLAGRDPASYGQTLLTVAEVAQRAAAGRTFPAWLAPSIIGPGELERRVAGILDDRRDRRSQVGRPLRWGVVIGLLVSATLAMTTRVVAVGDEPRPQQATPPASGKAPPPVVIRWTGIPRVDPEDPILHRGVVFGPDGKPLAGASVHAARSIELLERTPRERLDPRNLGPVRAVTDSEGRFQFNAEDLTWVTVAGVRKRYETLLVATKDGLVSGWLKTFGDDRSFRWHWHPSRDKDVAVRLRLPATPTGRLLLKGDGPLSGARIVLIGLMAPVEYDLDRHIPREEEHALSLFETIDYAETLYRPSILPGLATETTTDNQGRFELPGLPEGFIAEIEITHPRAVTTRLRLAVRAIEPVYRRPFMDHGEPEVTLYGSGLTAELEKGTVLRGQVVSAEWGHEKKAIGVTVALANHNSAEGMDGQRFTTDADGRFELTGLLGSPQGYELAFVGSYAAPWRGHRQTIFPEMENRVTLTPAIPYRLELKDGQGHAVDRPVYSIVVQAVPGSFYRDAKERFNVPERIAPGVYQGIVPAGPAAVLVERHKSDRPLAVNPKAIFAPDRADWTLEEERYAYGDSWRIAGAGVSTTDNLAPNGNPLYEQLDLSAAVFTNARPENMKSGVLELSAIIRSDPPVEFTLVDEAGQPVENARLVRQLARYKAEGLPAEFAVQGLHPERAEFLMFRQDERGLIATLTTTWKEGRIKVTMRPAATLLGRFVDRSGALDFNFGARIVSSGVMPETYIAGRMFDITARPGEGRGEFRLIVPPGVEVRGDLVRKSHDWNTRPTIRTAFGPLTPKPGEIIDLGDLTVP